MIFKMNYVELVLFKIVKNHIFQHFPLHIQRRRKQSRAGGGAASRKRAPYLTLTNKQKSLTLKNSLTLLNLHD